MGRRRRDHSLAEQILEHADPARLDRQLSDAERVALQRLWKFWARPNQLPPYACDDVGCGCNGEWVYWLLLAGRGFGKTRTSAEWFREVAPQQSLINLIGPTFDDVRAIMLEGESGLFAVCNNAERPTWKRADRKLVWPNGAESLIFTADEPDRLRGKQHRGVWAEEVAAWRYAEEALDQMKLGLRLPGKDGWRPRAVLATTPKPYKWLRELIDEEDDDGHRLTHVTRGTTYENKANLDPIFYSKVIRDFEGTRKGREQLLGEILTDVVGALWKRHWIDVARVRALPQSGIRKTVVGVDPAATHGEDAADTGIVVASQGFDRQYYVVGDGTCHESPLEWATQALNAAAYHGAHTIIAEANNGGKMVQAVIEAAGKEWKRRNPGRLPAPVELVWASDGKRTRAEPIATMYETGVVHHVGTFPDLEDQLCEWVPKRPGDSPDRLDALVWAIHSLAAGATVADQIPEAMPSPWRKRDDDGP